MNAHLNTSREPIRPSPAGAIQRKRCGSCQCDDCLAAKRVSLQRRATDSMRSFPDELPSAVQEVLRSPGAPLAAAERTFMSSRFGHDFSSVRIHADARAAASARAVSALAYTSGSDVVFGAGQYLPGTDSGRRLLAHELAHVAQQARGHGGGAHTRPESPALEANADTAADAALAGRPVSLMPAAIPAIQRRAAPYIKKVSVHLAPAQTADLEWEGAAPASATGSDHFMVSTGKGYSDPGDPAGTCSRGCCTDALTQCAPPWNEAGRVGACCTFHGNDFWTGTPEESHNGWNWWTPIQPAYSSRGIALHQHTEVTGQPIGHGCVRMADANAKRIYDFSNGRSTQVALDGRAAPVLCEAGRRCGAGGGASGAAGEAEHAPSDQATAINQVEAVPGLEGEMT